MTFPGFIFLTFISAVVINGLLAVLPRSRALIRSGWFLSPKLGCLILVLFIPAAALVLYCVGRLSIASPLWSLPTAILLVSGFLLIMQCASFAILRDGSGDDSEQTRERR